MALAASVLTCLALATMANGPTSAALQREDTAALADGERAAQRSSRSYDRPAAAPAESSEATSTVPKVLADPKAEKEAAQAKAAEEAKAAKAAVTAPVAGLSQAQMSNAQRIVEVGREMGLPERAYVIAVATAIQESQLYNLASEVIPESFDYAPEGSGSDHDSVGLFQQRPSAGWGSVQNLMTPAYAAKAFYQVLTTVPGWDSMALTYAAQAVQVSAFPEAYAKHEERAQAIVDAVD